MVCGGSTVTANSSGGIKVNFGLTSATALSTLVFPTPFGGGMTSVATPPMASGPMVIDFNDLSIQTEWFSVETNEAAHGGWSAFVFGE
jgi:hypothetical protein